jgi:hypothetical protein
MPETPQQYTQRILGNVAGKDALRIQRGTAAQLKKLTKGLNKKQLTWYPEAGKWSITEILAHLADTEIVASWRLRLILGSNGTPILGFDQDSWASTLQYAKSDPKWSIEVFRVLRENNLRMLKSIPKPLWENYGMHSERGRESVAHIARMFAGHDINHLRQIEGIRKLVKAGKGKRRD